MGQNRTWCKNGQTDIFLLNLKADKSESFHQICKKWTFLYKETLKYVGHIFPANDFPFLRPWDAKEIRWFFREIKSFPESAD